MLADADALSRLPLAHRGAEAPPLLEVLLLEMVPEAPLHAGRISSLKQKDPVLSCVLHWLLHGWPEGRQEGCFKPFMQHRNELSAHKNSVLWGSRLVVPLAMRTDVLKMLHDAQPGIVHMKALDRSFLCPGIDYKVERVVRACEACQLTRHNSPKAPLHP